MALNHADVLQPNEKRPAERHVGKEHHPKVALKKVIDDCANFRRVGYAEFGGLLAIENEYGRASAFDRLEVPRPERLAFPRSPKAGHFPHPDLPSLKEIKGVDLFAPCKHVG